MNLNSNYPTIKSSDIILREEFISTFDVVKNGGELGGSPVIDHGYEGDGSTDYLTYPNFHWNNHKIFTFHCKIDEIDSFSSKAVFGSPDANGPMLRFTSSTSISFWTDTGAASTAFVIPAFENGDTISVRYNDTTKKALVYKNGVASTTGEQTMSQQIHSSATTLQMFGRLNSLDIFDGKVKNFAWFSRELSDDELLELDDSSTYRYKDSLIAAWYFQDKIGDSTPYTTSGFGKHSATATLGDGSTSTTFPTKLIGRNGYSFDGSDYINCGISPLNDSNAESFSVALWAELDLMDYDSAFTVLTDTSGANFGSQAGFTLYLDDRGSSYPTEGAQFGLNTVTGNYRLAKSNDNAVRNGLNLFVGTYDSSNAEVKLYINGVDQTSAQSGTGSGGINSSTDNLYVGGTKTPGSFSTGNILSIETYNKPLTLTHVKDILNAGPIYLGDN